MKWFKHYSSARGDERISHLEDISGLEGYGFYFKILEVIAEIMDSSNVCEVTYSRSRWGRQLNITTKKFLTLAQRCSDVGLITFQQQGEKCTIAAPNILKYRDNHTKNLQATNKLESSNLDLEKEKEKEKETTIAVDDKKPSSHAVLFDAVKGSFSNVNGHLEIWSKAYPAVSIETELNKAAAWLMANPKNKKSNYSRFLNSWLSRCQDSAKTVKNDNSLGKFI